MLDQKVTSKKFCIGIIDDQALFANALKELLLSFVRIQDVSILPTPQGRLYPLDANAYDLLLLDILMPNMDGWQLFSMIKKRYPNLKVAILSSKQDSISIERAKKIGAFGYIFKSADKHTLRKALEMMLVKNKACFFRNLPSDEKNLYTFQNGKKAIITNRELEFLQLLLQEHSSKRIAKYMNISEHTVVGYRKGLFQKLGVTNMIGLAKYAFEIFAISGRPT